MARPRTTIAEDHVRQSPPIDLDNRAASEIEVVPPLKTPETELELFMNDVLTILVAESTDENATPMVEVAVNGRRVFIPRGQATNSGFDDLGRRVPIKRMHVERLARAKKTTYRQNLDPRLGEGVNKLHVHRALDYPFAVVEDPAPNGREWLQRVLAEA